MYIAPESLLSICQITDVVVFHVGQRHHVHYIACCIKLIKRRDRQEVCEFMSKVYIEKRVAI